VTGVQTCALPICPGDGSTTFNLPNSVNNTLVGAGSLASLGSSVGSSTHTLTTSEIPTSLTVTDTGHIHQAKGAVSGSVAALGLGTNGVNALVGGAASGDGAYTTNAQADGLPFIHSSTTGISVGGGGAAHSIVQPSLGVTYIIKF